MDKEKTDYIYIRALKCENLRTIHDLLASNSLSLTNWIGDLGVTALHLAIGYGTEAFALSVTDLLLNHGSDSNAPSSCGKTSVHIAAAWGRAQILKLLLLNGGDPWRQDKERKNAFNYAFEYQEWDIMNVLHDFQLAPKKNCVLTQSPTEKNEYMPISSENSRKTYVTKNKFIINKVHDIHLEDKNFLKEEIFCNEEILLSFDAKNDVVEEKQELNNEIGNKTFIVEPPKPALVDNQDLFSELLAAVRRRTLRISGIETLNSCNEDIQKTEEIEVIDVSDNSAAFLSLSPDNSGNYESCCELSGENLKKTEDEFEKLRDKLRGLGMNPGPITQSTKAIYERQLERLVKQGFTSPPPKLLQDTSSDGGISTNFSPELINAIENPTSTDYTDLEKIVCSHFSKPEFTGSPKTCFNYLLLDSRKTLNLPRRTQLLSAKEIFSQFLAAIFYVGKGQAGRPYAHLQQARQAYEAKEEPEHPKEKAIINVWRNGHGIICLQVFHNIISDEALTREAAMIHALGRQHLHNLSKGSYKGCVSLWDPVRQRMLGVHLLIKAKELFLRDDERPLFPNDF